MNDDHPAGEARPMIARERLNTAKRKVRASQRGSALPRGVGWALGASPIALERRIIAFRSRHTGNLGLDRRFQVGNA